MRAGARLAELEQLGCELQACAERFLTPEQMESLDAAGSDAIEGCDAPERCARGWSGACKALCGLRGRLGQAEAVSRADLSGDKRGEFLALLCGIGRRIQRVQDEMIDGCGAGVPEGVPWY